MQIKFGSDRGGVLQVEPSRPAALASEFPPWLTCITKQFFSPDACRVSASATALQIAKEFEVAGFVGNLADGRVQLEAEGDAAEVADFIAAVEERMHGFIRKVERTAGSRAPQFRGFGLK